MKICIWTSSLFDLGGTKRVITLLVNELISKHDVTVMTHESKLKENRSMYNLSQDVHVDFMGDSDVMFNERAKPSFVYKYVMRINDINGYFNNTERMRYLVEALYPETMRNRLIKYLNEKQYDMIIAAAGLSLLLGILSPDLKAKTIGWQHNCYDGYINVKKVVFWKKEKLLKKYLPQLDRYIVLSRYDKESYESKLGIKCDVMVNPRSFVSPRKADMMHKKFLVVTRFVEAKGMDLLFKSFAEFCKYDKEWDMDILGDGELRNQLINQAQGMGILSRMKFIGITDQVAEYYLSSSLLLLPSRWEGWPMVVMEAFEFGLPVIAYDIASMDLMIPDEIDGFIIEKFDTKKYAQAMLKLAHDYELRCKMSQNAVKRANDFAIEKIVDDWNELFQKMRLNDSLVSQG